MGAKKLSTIACSNVQRNGCRIWNLIKEGFVSFKKVEDLNFKYKGLVKTIEKKLKTMGIILSDEFIFGIVKEKGFSNDIYKF